MSSKPRTRSRAAAAAAATAGMNSEANTAAVPTEEPRRSRKKRQPAAAMEISVDFVDDQPDIGQTLHAKDGKLGFFTSSKGFVYATNFLVDIVSHVHSERYVLSFPV